MTAPTDWLSAFSQEIAHAQLARSSGNEGMARVCARRAVGIVIGEYLRLAGLPTSDPSAYQRIKRLETIPKLDPEIIRVARHFVLSVNHNHQLPIQADLIAEAQWLAEALLGKKE